MKKYIILIAITLGILASCKDPFSGESSFLQSTSALAAASYMDQNDSLNLSMWVDLLKYTDMYNTMNLASSYTCFVPTNNALQAYLTTKGVSKVTDLSLSDAVTLVKYHTIAGATYSAVSFEDGMISDTTATGDYLVSSFATDGGAVVINQEAKITKTINVSNGYIHILNHTLTPVTETLYEKIKSDRYSIFRQAVEACGYQSLLNTSSAIINGSTYKYHYTLFAVSDSIFKLKNISSLQNLVDTLKAGSDYSSSANLLNQYVAYHLVNQQLSYSTLSDFESTSSRSQNYATMATNQLFNISEVNKVLYVNYSSSLGSGISFVKINNNSKNGVLHEVNGIMKVTTPPTTTVKWEVTDYTLMSSLLPKYRVTGLSSTYTYSLTSDLFTCYKWASVPQFRISPLVYVIANKNDAVAYKAVNKDYLRFNLGKYGTLSMTLPLIIAGKYTVTIGHYLTKATANQGILKFYIDNNELGTIYSQSSTITSSQYVDDASTSAMTVNFSSSTTHTIKVLAADDYTSDIDYIKFTPAN